VARLKSTASAASSPNLNPPTAFPKSNSHRDDVMGFSVLIVDDEHDVAETQ